MRGAQYGAGIQKEIPCPKGMVGRVIGKGGETIKALQKNFGANIQIDQTTDPMKITIAGQPPAVEACGAAVQEIVNGGNPYLGPAGGAGGYGEAPPPPPLRTCCCPAACLPLSHTHAAYACWPVWCPACPLILQNHMAPAVVRMVLPAKKLSGIRL